MNNKRKDTSETDDTSLNDHYSIKINFNNNATCRNAVAIKNRIKDNE